MTTPPRAPAGPRPAATRDARVVETGPVRLALQASARQREGITPEPFCASVGRPLLLAQLRFSDWVLRRVEQVRFQDDRNVHRQMSIEFRIRDDAPVFVQDGQEYCAVPLMLMRRRTLVDFHMLDEDGRPVSMPGLRLVQQLDQSLLLAAASTHPTVDGASLADDPHVREFVQRLVVGRAGDVQKEWNAFVRNEPEQPSSLRALRDWPHFVSTARMLRTSFTLYVFLPKRSPERLLRLSFIEPIRWSYHRPWLEPVADARTTTYAYRPMAGGSVWRMRLSRVPAALGLTPTRIRLQVPSAERAASYHFEAVAPPGVRIVRASLVAGRPHGGAASPRGAPTVDHDASGTVTVGLHGVEVPTGSLCRAQLELRVQSAGWLAVMAWACFAITGVLASVSWHYWETPESGSSQDDNVVVLLLTTAAAAATVVAHREFVGVAARLLVGVRAVAAACIGLPVLAAGFITFVGEGRGDGRLLTLTTAHALLALAVAAFTLSVFIAVVYGLSRWAERPGRRSSPWDMTPRRRPPRTRLRPRTDPDPPSSDLIVLVKDQDGPPDEFFAAVREHRLDRPAVGIPSSDAWHEWYDVTDRTHDDEVRRLRACTAWSGCPRTDSASCCGQAAPSVIDLRGPAPSRDG